MTTLSPFVLAVAAWLAPSPAAAKGKQSKAGNPPAVLQPGRTKTAHEIGASFNPSFSPNQFSTRFNWRMNFPSTTAFGQLGGLFIGVNTGPSFGFGGGVNGVAGFDIGYEIDPWSNLALTFSPVLHTDTYFDPDWWSLQQTAGVVIRLYLKQHWVVYFDPASFGWSTGRGGGVGYAMRFAWGFAYKF